MAQPFLGEIEFFGFNFPPKNWALCAGQILPINQYQALFSLLGTTYGGNGITNFMLPDLRGRVPIGQGSGGGLTPRLLGAVGGEETHTLVPSELPKHTHQVNADANTAATVVTLPAGHLLAVGLNKSGGGSVPINLYGTVVPDVTMGPNTIGPSNGATAHANMMPYLVLNACIALSGIFPSRN
jgi:microcystin-dependent protein